MSRRSNIRVRFSPDINEKPTASLKFNTDFRTIKSPKRVSVGGRASRLLRIGGGGLCPLKLFRRLSVNVAKALRLMSRRRRSSVMAATDLRCRSISSSSECHRDEAFQDCIEFINSSYKSSS
ncbi:hypothetical protein QJS04_geneDACA007579 [Acorus gramineus]|uniref:Josephin-like protein n=1 Tax=Acorus gramineus TaxID=55184 RepID=A0AAV9B6L6_ACOGR|nr:hypothetical protein QJS04_geneDACA007579 [Acorus gramineus]